MRAAILTSPDAVPTPGDFPDPEPSPGRPLLSLVGAGVHPVVRAVASGRHYGSSDAYPLIPGIDAVARTPDGGLVYTGWPRAPWGTMAELLATPVGVPLPSGVDPLAIAAGMNPALAGWMPLRRRRAERGALGTVLVLGATGMAGHLAVQAAVALGVTEVIAAGRDAAALERAWAAGARPVSLAEGPESLRAAVADTTPELVLDFVWGAVAEAAFEALGRRGLGDDDGDIAYVQIGSVAGAEAALPAALLRSRRITVSGSGAGSVETDERLAALPEVMALVANGTLSVPYTPYPLSRVADAWTHIGHDRAVVVPD